MDWLTDLEPWWAWLVIGLLLAGAEMAVPGVFLIWLAGAALVTGIVSWIAPIGLPAQAILFGLLAVFSVFLGKRYLRDNPVEEADPGLNRRGRRLVGQIGTVSQAIEDGSGRIRCGDSEWLAQGKDAPLGARVRITGNEGVVLLVEPVSPPALEAPPAV